MGELLCATMPNEIGKWFQAKWMVIQPPSARPPSLRTSDVALQRLRIQNLLRICYKQQTNNGWTIDGHWTENTWTSDEQWTNNKRTTDKQKMNNKWTEIVTSRSLLMPEPKKKKKTCNIKNICSIVFLASSGPFSQTQCSCNCKDGWCWPHVCLSCGW